MDLLMIQRDASAASLSGNLLLAIEAAKSGRSAAVVVTGEALAALVRGSFGWPRELSGQAARQSLADAGKSLGLPVAGRGEGRRIDAVGLITQARDAGVKLYACPIWCDLLSLNDDLPADLTRLDRAEWLEMLGAAARVVGSL